MDRMLDWTVAREMRASVWLDDESNLMVYLKIMEKDRQNILKGVSCDL